MNITGSLVEYPRWSDYYVPEDVSDDYPAQDMDGAQGLETLFAPTPEERALGDLKIRSVRLVERALMSKDIWALYDRASTIPTKGNALGSWMIEFERDREFEALCDFDNRKIIIDEKCSDDGAVIYLVFELTNAISFEKYDALREKVISGQMPCEKFVKKVERLEFKNTLLHSEVMKNAIQERGWSNELDFHSEYHEKLRKIVEKSNGGLRLELKDLHREMCEQDWILRKNTTHADFFRKQWKQLAPSIPK